jgi:hypothetical protein
MDRKLDTSERGISPCHYAHGAGMAYCLGCYID